MNNKTKAIIAEVLDAIGTMVSVAILIFLIAYAAPILAAVL